MRLCAFQDVSERRRDLAQHRHRIPRRSIAIDSIAMQVVLKLLSKRAAAGSHLLQAGPLFSGRRWRSFAEAGAGRLHGLLADRLIIAVRGVVGGATRVECVLLNVPFSASSAFGITSQTDLAKLQQVLTVTD